MRRGYLPASCHPPSPTCVPVIGQVGEPGWGEVICQPPVILPLYLLGLRHKVWAVANLRVKNSSLNCTIGLFSISSVGALRTACEVKLFCGVGMHKMHRFLTTTCKYSREIHKVFNKVNMETSMYTVHCTVYSIVRLCSGCLAKRSIVLKINSKFLLYIFWGNNRCK